MVTTVHAEASKISALLLQREQERINKPWLQRRRRSQVSTSPFRPAHQAGGRPRPAPRSRYVADLQRQLQREYGALKSQAHMPVNYFAVDGGAQSL